MNTRSNLKLQLTKASQLLVDIDFDDASNEWHKNKKSIGNSQYKYICTVITNKSSNKSNKSNNLCNKVCYQLSDKCWIHRNK